MPRNVKLWEGPSTFSRASGIPRVEHTSLIVARLCAHVEDPGGSGVARPGPTRACALPSTSQALPSPTQLESRDSTMKQTKV